MDYSSNILITGGAGYIGSHACKILSSMGYTPIVFDNLSVGHETSIKWGPFIRGDLKDKRALEYTFNKYKPFAVMHFAADALVGESVVNPGKYYENNVYSTVVLLEQMVKYNIKNIIFSSTCATYGIPSSIPILENHEQKPINPYGRSKLMIEQILDDYSSAYGINYAALRYFNAAGADLDSEIGENHKIETHLIPLIIKAALGISPSINVFGTDYPTDDGSAVRDYIHVIDLISAHIKALDHIKKTNENIKLNLGTGHGYSVLDIIQAVKKITKKDFNINYCDRREGDPPILYANCNKAKSLLGWEPIYSDIETIIKSAWNWHKKISL